MILSQETCGEMSAGCNTARDVVTVLIIIGVCIFWLAVVFVAVWLLDRTAENVSIIFHGPHDNNCICKRCNHERGRRQ